MAEFPLGYRFKPTNTQLVGYYLTHKLYGQPLPSPNPIMDCDVYSNHPFNVLKAKGVLEDENGAMEGYFFCRLKKASANGKNINRCIIGHGTWSNKSKPKDVYDEAMRMIGKVRYFKFQPAEDKKSEPVNKIEWKMHEYSVAENDLVLCHLTNKVDSSKDDVGISRGLKRVPNYEIGSSSKHCRVEKSPECPSTAINNPAQAEDQVGHQVMQYGFQNQQYYMPTQSIHQQYTMPPGAPNEVQYVRPHRFPEQVKYVMPLEPHQQYATPQGHGLPDRQYTMSHGHESTTYEAFGDGFDRMITSDQSQLAQGGGTYYNDKHDVTILNYSLSESVNDNIQVPQQNYQIHDEQAVFLPSSDEELSILNDEERCDTQNDDNGDEETSIRALTEEIEGMMNNGKENDTDNHEETSIRALTEEIEGMMNNDKENDTNNHVDEDATDEAFIEELEGIPSDPHEAQGDELYDEQDMTTNNEMQEDTSWRSKLGFEHEDDEADFSWLPALAAA